MHNRAGLADRWIRVIVAMGLVAALTSALLPWDCRAWAFEGDKHHRGYGAWEIWNPEAEGFLWFWIPVLILAIGLLLALGLLKPWKDKPESHDGEQV